MNLFESLKELFQLQSTKIKDLISNTAKDINDSFNKTIQSINATIDDIKKEIKELEEKAQITDKAFQSINSTLEKLNISKENELTIDKVNDLIDNKIANLKKQSEQIKNETAFLKSILGLDNIDSDKIKSAEDIDEALKDNRIRFQKPSTYDFLNDNFDAIKKFLSEQNNKQD